MISNNIIKHLTLVTTKLILGYQHLNGVS